MLNSIIDNNDLSENGIGAYVALRLIYNQGRDIYCETLNAMYICLMGVDKFIDSRRIRDNLKLGLYELAGLCLINILDEKSSEYIMNLSKLNIGKYDATGKHFTTIDTSELYAIMNCKGVDRLKLLRYFIYLMYTCKSKSGIRVGYEYVVNLSNSLGIDDETIYKYNDLLYKMKLIYVYKTKDSYIDSNGNFTSIPNTYGRYIDKAKIIEVGKEHEEKYGHQYQSRFKKEHSNKIKSASQKYFAFCNGKEYPEAILKEIYLTLIEFNKYQYDECRKKDLTVFSEYDFYSEDTS